MEQDEKFYLNEKVKINSKDEFIEMYGDFEEFSITYPLGWAEEMNNFFERPATIVEVDEDTIYSPLLLLKFEGNEKTYWYVGNDTKKII